MQITLLYQKLILTADNQIKTRRLGLTHHLSPSAILHRPPLLLLTVLCLLTPAGISSGRDRLFRPALIVEGLSVCLCVCVCVCVSACTCVCLRSTGADCALWLCSLLPRPPQLEQSSQHLPLKGKHNVDNLEATGDFFQDAVLLPQLVQLPVALRAEVQWIAPSGNQKDLFKGLSKKTEMAK